MSWYKSGLGAIAALTCCTVVAANAAEVVSPGKVTDVTLYRNQAMVTRTIGLEGESGAFELIVPDLPEAVVADSMFAEGEEGVDVRAVEFRSRAVMEAPREEVRTLESEIESLQRDIDLHQKKLELADKRTKYLDKLESFVAPTAKTELTRGVLNAETLEKLVKFSFEQRDAVLQEQVDLEHKLAELKNNLELAQRKLKELTNGATRTVREAVVYLRKRNAEASRVRLNYLVTQCGWSPSYVLRAGADREKVGVEYNGLIRQMSGESWEGVVLTLSTASPALSASRPGLAPFKVTLAAPRPPQQQVEMAQQQAGIQQPFTKGGDVYQQLRAIRDRQNSGLMANNYAYNLDDNNRASWSINDAATDLQCLEFTAEGAQVQALSSGQSMLADGPSLSYRLADGVSLKSRRDQQMVRIMNADFSSRFYHVATPLLTTFVFREAELTNDSEQDLLNGPITVYLDGRFVGRSEISTVARGQTLVVGFGADPQLRTRRELADRGEGVQGGNRELTFQYRLVVENFKDEDVQVRVLDRLPDTNRESEIRVRLADMKTPISEDTMYNRLERPQGILRWDVLAPARSTGEDAKLIVYGYTVEHDRNYRLATPADSDNLLKEFENLQRMRNRR